MDKCVSCGRLGTDYFTNEEEPICGDCIGAFFNCPGCGRVFLDWAADAGDGFCSACTGE